MIYTVITIVIVLVCFLLTVVVLLQSGQGQGMAGIAATNPFGNAGVGTRRTADILSKATTVLGTALLVLCLAANLVLDRGNTIQPAIQDSDNIDNIAPLPSETTPNNDLNTSSDSETQQQ